MTPARRLRFLLPTLSLVLLAQGAQAQLPADERSFDVQLFHPPVGPHGFITLDTAKVPAHGLFGLALTSSYQRSAFSIEVESDRAELAGRFDVVHHQIASELTAAVGLYDIFEVGVGLPLTLYLTGNDYNSMGQPDQKLTAAGIGDIRIETKARLGAVGPGKEVTFALAPGLTLPTGDGSKFLGEKTVTGRVRAITELAIPRFRAGLMVGFFAREKTHNFKAELGNQVLYTLALEARLHKDAALLGEWSGRVGSTQFVDANPSEIDLGMRVGLPHMFSLTFGGGAGLSRAIGAPQFRAFLGVGWAPDFRDADGDGVPDAEDRCPNEPEDRDGFRDGDGCPDPDNDGDGIADALDKCPNDPEDLDQFQDEDGCPELDNDGDGIPDLNDPCPNAAEDGRGKRPRDGCPSSSEDSDGDGIADGRDKCPDEPEDRDGFEDQDGCPDVDNDNDGIPDGYDACPNEPEDQDGFEDTDGCPDPDNDKDGIVDAKDRCPNQPETLNGNRDDDGCPDPGAEIVRLNGDRIEVRERINFGGGGQLTPASSAVIDLVAMVLRGHAELAKVRIELTGGGDAQARAETIIAELVRRGVEASRLTALSKNGPVRMDIIVESRTPPRKAGAPPAPLHSPQ
jgi:OmpA-OmpF porin, OOP family